MGKENQEEYDTRWEAVLRRDEQNNTDFEQSSEDTNSGEQNETS